MQLFTLCHALSMRSFEYSFAMEGYQANTNNYLFCQHLSATNFSTSIMIIPRVAFRNYVIAVSKWLRHRLMKICSPLYFTLYGFLSLILLGLLHSLYDVPLRYQLCPPSYWAESLDTGFEGFDNESGIVNGHYIVPNYVHFLRYSSRLAKISFMDAVSILAAFKNQKPDKIFFHTNLREFKGEYWNTLLKIPGFNETIEFRYIEPLKSIFGQPLHRRFKLWHSSDLLRIDILRRFGGIFIDNDVYLVRNMDKFRRLEMSLEIFDHESFGTMTLVAHRDARFLKLWWESYRTYYSHIWYYNAGKKPKIEILNSRPELVHNVPNLFGIGDWRVRLYISKWKKWKSQYTIHMLLRHFYGDFLTHNSLNLTYPVTFTKFNIQQYNVTILDMVLDCCSELLR